MNTARFAFPNFTITRFFETANHENVVGKLKLGENVFTIHLFRRIGLPDKAYFLVSKIYDRTGHAFLWEFPAVFEGIGVLSQADSEPVVALIEHGSRNVSSIVTISSFCASRPMSMQRKIELKRLAAKYLDCGYTLSDTERTVAQLDFKKQQEQLVAEESTKKTDQEQRRKERLERLEGRPSIKAFTRNGNGSRFGTPVVGEEWHSLPHGINVILVESYDDKTGEHGPVIEAFRVAKNGGRPPEKDYPTMVTQERPKPVGANIPKPLGVILVELGGETHDVLVYGTMDEIRTARAAGLNHGTYVASNDTKSGDRFQIYSVHASNIETISLQKPLVA